MIVRNSVNSFCEHQITHNFTLRVNFDWLITARAFPPLLRHKAVISDWFEFQSLITVSVSIVMS